MIVPGKSSLRYDLALQQPPAQPGAAGAAQQALQQNRIAQMQALQQDRMDQLLSQIPAPISQAVSTNPVMGRANVYDLSRDFSGSLADPSTLQFTPQNGEQPTTQVQGMNPLPDKNPEPYQILYDPSISRDPVSIGMPMIEPAVVGPMLDQYRQNKGLGTMDPSVVGPNLQQVLDQYRQNKGLGGANPGLGGPPPGQNAGGGFGGGFGGNFNSMQNRAIPDIAAQTVGETVSQAIQSRIPQMSQGIGSLIGQSLLSNGGGQSLMPAIQNLF